eukprot:GFYU01002264.1.p1 GENE.GFYU01002264.1~~GFYU01002264.1.p1  ORF type:complete len:502 (+),score=31.72 GFYU01002264.1:65-1570(+)
MMPSDSRARKESARHGGGASMAAVMMVVVTIFLIAATGAEASSTATAGEVLNTHHKGRHHHRRHHRHAKRKLEAANQACGLHPAPRYVGPFCLYPANPGQQVAHARAGPAYNGGNCVIEVSQDGGNAWHNITLNPINQLQAGRYRITLDDIVNALPNQMLNDTDTIVRCGGDQTAPIQFRAPNPAIRTRNLGTDSFRVWGDFSHCHCGDRALPYQIDVRPPGGHRAMHRNVADGAILGNAAELYQTNDTGLHDVWLRCNPPNVGAAGPYEAHTQERAGLDLGNQGGWTQFPDVATALHNDPRNRTLIDAVATAMRNLTGQGCINIGIYTCGPGANGFSEVVVSHPGGNSAHELYPFFMDKSGPDSAEGGYARFDTQHKVNWTTINFATGGAPKQCIKKTVDGDMFVWRALNDSKARCDQEHLNFTATYFDDRPFCDCCGAYMRAYNILDEAGVVQGPYNAWATFITGSQGAGRIGYHNGTNTHAGNGAPVHGDNGPWGGTP